MTNRYTSVHMPTALRWRLAFDFTAPLAHIAVEPSPRRPSARAVAAEATAGELKLDSRVAASGVKRSGYSIIDCKQ